MTKNQRMFEQELKRLQRSVERLTAQHKFVQSIELPAQPKRISKRHLKTLKELKGRHFVSEIDVDTGEVIREAEYEQIYKTKIRHKSYSKPAYNPEKARAYRKAHAEQIRQSNKRYRETHREQIAKRQREYRKANRDKINAQRREYRAKNRDSINAKARAYREANKDKINRQARVRRIKKKVEPQRAPVVSKPWDIYEELLLRFQEAKEEAIRDKVPVLMYKLECIEELIGILERNREEMGAGDYMAYLKDKEDVIADQLHELVQASSDDKVTSWKTSILLYLNATNIDVSRETLEKFSMANEGGWQ